MQREDHDLHGGMARKGRASLFHRAKMMDAYDGRLAFKSGLKIEVCLSVCTID